MHKFLIMLMVALFAWTVAHTACAGGGSLIGERVSGNWRFCTYDHGGGDIRVVRVHSSNPCPPSN